MEKQREYHLKDESGLQRRNMQTDPYADLYLLPHPVSRNHPRMTMQERAAQFSPFAALTGYEGEIMETARLTEAKKELTEEAKMQLDRKLSVILCQIEMQKFPEVSVTYFLPDSRKEGGKYLTGEGAVCRADPGKRMLQIEGIGEIPLDEIKSLTLL